MDKISAFFQNSWVVGIIGGIISGLIVYWITFVLVERRKRNNHEKDIMSANNAVLSVIRPYIADSGIPDEKRIDAIANAISRKYKIGREEMYSLPEIYEDLVLEFMSNLYIPTETKKTTITELLENVTQYQETKKQSATDQSASANDKKPTVSTVSEILSSLAAFITMLVFTFSVNAFNENGMKTAVLISLVVVVAELLILIFSMYKGKHKRGRKIFEDTIRISNSGKPINEVLDDSFVFVNYFDDTN